MRKILLRISGRAKKEPQSQNLSLTCLSSQKTYYTDESSNQTCQYTHNKYFPMAVYELFKQIKEIYF